MMGAKQVRQIVVKVRRDQKHIVGANDNNARDFALAA